MDKKRIYSKEIAQKIADTELAFEYDLGVEYQERLMKHREQILENNERKKEGDSSKS